MFLSRAIPQKLKFGEWSPRSTNLNVTLLCVAMAAISVVAVRASVRDQLFRKNFWADGGFQEIWFFAAAWSVATVCLARWARSHAVTILSGICLFCLTVAFGVAAVVAVGWFCLASYCLGNALAFYTGHALRDGPADRLIAGLVGAGVYMFLLSFMVHFPINYAPVYYLLLAVPLWMERNRSLQDCGQIKRILNRVSITLPVCLLLSLVAFLLICQMAMSAQPDMGWDSLAMHLAAPAFVRNHGFWNFDVRTSFWAVMPMAADWAFTLVYVIAGEAATHLLNLCALAVCMILMFVLIRRNSSRETALLLIAAFLSVPLTQIETNTLFVENFLAAFLLAAFAALLQLRVENNRFHIVSFFVLCGIAFEIKLGASAFFFPLLVCYLVSALFASRERGRARSTWLPVVIFLALAASPYVVAYLKTGNPVFPFLNHTFHSPYWPPSNLIDFRWTTPLSFRTLGDMTFHSDRHVEYYNGALGVLYYVLTPLAALALLLGIGSFVSAAAFFVAVCSFALVCLQMTYLRYIYPAAPFLLLAAAPALEYLRANLKKLYLAPALVIVFGVAVNVSLSPAAVSQFGLNPFDPEGAYKFELSHRPERLAIDYLNLCFPGEPVAFLTTPPDVTGLIGQAYQNFSYNHEFAEEVASAADRAGLRRIAARHGLRLFVYWSGNLANLSAPVREFLAKDTRKLAAFNGVFVCEMTTANDDAAGAGH